MVPQTKVGDRERERAVEDLGDLYVDGVLSEAELEDRIGQALCARTAAQLAALVADCPPLRTRSPAGRRRSGLRYLVAAGTAAVLLGVGGTLTGAIGPVDAPPSPPCDTAAAADTPTCLVTDGG